MAGVFSDLPCELGPSNLSFRLPGSAAEFTEIIEAGPVHPGPSKLYVITMTSLKLLQESNHPGTAESLT